MGPVAGLKASTGVSGRATDGSATILATNLSHNAFRNAIPKAELNNVLNRVQSTTRILL